MIFRIPSPLKAEHEELHEELANATRLTGPVGEAARGVARALHEHFQAEEDFALPPLGLLIPIMEDKVTPEMSGVLRLTDCLKSRYDKMLKEHEDIVAALRKLIEAARDEGMAEYVRLGEKIITHTKMEEDVLYPAAILVGEMIRIKTAALKS
jgi:hypothetical protein